MVTGTTGNPVTTDSFVCQLPFFVAAARARAVPGYAANHTVEQKEPKISGKA